MSCSAYVFDAYGTLFDVHSAVRAHKERLGADHERVSRIWREKQLEYTWTLTLMGKYEDFWILTEKALDFALASASAETAQDSSIREDLLNSYWNLECFPEIPAALARLKQAGKKLAILSNGSSAMIEAAVRSAGLTDTIADIFSVDRLKRFKPVPEIYRMVTDDYGLAPSAVSFQSSNRWDIAGAQSFGFKTVWVNRSGQEDEYASFAPDLVVRDLGDIPV